MKFKDFVLLYFGSSICTGMIIVVCCTFLKGKNCATSGIPGEAKEMSRDAVNQRYRSCSSCRAHIYSKALWETHFKHAGTDW